MIAYLSPCCFFLSQYLEQRTCPLFQTHFLFPVCFKFYNYFVDFIQKGNSCRASLPVGIPDKWLLNFCVR